MCSIAICTVLLLACHAPADTGLPGDTAGTVVEPAARVDVLVVGSGPAGLAAAWEAREAGASVLVLEREPVAGGAGGFAQNFLGVGTSWQADRGIEDSVEGAAGEWSSFTEGDGDDPQVLAFLEASSDTLEWLVDEFGDRVLDISDDPSAGQVPRIHHVFGPERASPIDGLVAELEDLVWVSHPVGELVFGEGGEVIGAAFTDLQDGSEGWVRAGATVLATGGFARDREALLEDRPELEATGLVYEAAWTSDGGGLSLVRQSGADWQNAGHYGVYVHSARDWLEGQEDEAIWLPELTSALIVDLDGRRVGDERLIQGFQLLDILLAAPGQRLFALFPEAVFQAQVAQRPAYNWADPDQPERLSPQELLDAGVAASFDDAAAVAAATGIDSEQLGATVERYDSLAGAGEDTDFGKPPSLLVAFDSSPIDVVELVPGPAKAFVGARVDGDGRVLDASGEPVDGLYAAGEVAGVLGTPAVGLGFSGSIAGCYYGGRVAGRAAAAEAR